MLLVVWLLEYHPDPAYLDGVDSGSFQSAFPFDPPLVVHAVTAERVPTDSNAVIGALVDVDIRYRMKSGRRSDRLVHCWSSTKLPLAIDVQVRVLIISLPPVALPGT